MQKECGGKNNGEKCFVIMPFSKTTDVHDENYWTEFFNIIKRIMESNGYSCTRSEVGPYKLFSNIVANIENSDVVVAVLTDFNSNVWYELGIRHTLKTGTIMLLQDDQSPPFDIKDFGIIFYKESLGLEQRIQIQIEDYLTKMDVEAHDSPVISALNNKVYNSVEKRLEEMQKLIWSLVDESSSTHKRVKSNIKEGQLKVLWVDDYPINNEAIMNLFKSKNVQFDIAISTDQGIELFQREYYDIIITDMGRGSESDAGLSLLKELKDLHCKTPVIVYASYTAIKKYGNEARQLGAYTITSGVKSIISSISEILQV